jgi:hypothetical protein
MHRVAIVITSTLEGPGLSAIYRALMFAQELRRAGDDAVVLFEGAGSTAAAAMLDPGHKLHPLFADVQLQLRGVCRHCARSYGVLQALQAAGVELLGDDRGHASLRRLLDEGRQIITF